MNEDVWGGQIKNAGGKYKPEDLIGLIAYDGSYFWRVSEASYVEHDEVPDDYTIVYSGDEVWGDGKKDVNEGYELWSIQRKNESIPIEFRTS